RHPVHQRRLRGAHDLPAPVPRPGRRRAHRPQRGGPARRQPDAAGHAGVVARPDRRRHEGRPDDGRGGRRPGAGGHDPRGARARAQRDHQAVRGAGGPAPPGRQAEVARPRALEGARVAARPHDLGADPVGRPQGRGRRRRGARRRARAAALDGFDGRGHHASDAGPLVAAGAAREAAHGRDRGPGARAVRLRAPRAHRRGAGLEAAEVGPAVIDPETGEAKPGAKDSSTRSYVKKACESIYKDMVRKKIAVEKRRPDGRGTEEIRPIEVEVGVNPRAHGSGLFTRGQTQILSSLTLGTAKEGQRIDDLSLEEERRYMHHYNFPPYSVGETGFMRGPKRRDIGHGALAERALKAVIPPADEFPYTIRIVSETLESNGSSSMGSVCGSTLSLMDAGVPIAAPVSGIAMGLVKEGDDYVILTDIQGAEDHLGDMDFKVAGSRDGITALQMDIKITGVTQQIMRDALEQAKRAREFILDKMLDVIPESRSELSDNAPRITTIKIDQEKIGMVIGKGGE